MATVVTAGIRFLHVPKTGGIWVTGAMFASGVAAWRPESLPFHADLADSREYADRFTFAFVRHPLAFWRSYWGYRMREGWDPDSDLDRQAASPDFEEFVNRVIEFAPGGAEATFERFVGTTGDEIDFVGRHERLADDLVAALRSAGEGFDESALRAHPHANVSDYDKAPAIYTRRTAERLAECERATIERFYPADPIPQRFLDEAYEPRLDPALLRGRVEQLEVELRDTRAQLAIWRRAALSDQALIAEQQARFEDAEERRRPR
jgi:hypothetical protein